MVKKRRRRQRPELLLVNVHCIVVVAILIFFLPPIQRHVKGDMPNILDDTPNVHQLLTTTFLPVWVYQRNGMNKNTRYVRSCTIQSLKWILAICISIWFCHLQNFDLWGHERESNLQNVLGLWQPHHAIVFQRLHFQGAEHTCDRIRQNECIISDCVKAAFAFVWIRSALNYKGICTALFLFCSGRRGWWGTSRVKLGIFQIFWLAKPKMFAITALLAVFPLHLAAYWISWP